jgi:hypothetical protein
MLVWFGLFGGEDHADGALSPDDDGAADDAAADAAAPHQSNICVLT